MLKTKISKILAAAFLLFLPNMAVALEMPKVFSDFPELNLLTAKSYLVTDKSSGKVLVYKNPDIAWTPASLTKLVTAMVVLDLQPKLDKTVAMKKDDEVGGARIATKAGIKYRTSDLFYASLVASANNATNALARSTGLSKEEFVAKMNQKAKDLGAKNTVFVEPTGISEKNLTTAEDYGKITAAAFLQGQIRNATTAQTYSFKATNNRKYFHNLKNTDKLLKDSDLKIVGGKTGYLEESMYNFTAEIKDRFGDDLVIALFGSQNNSTQFSETKQLAAIGGLAKVFLPKLEAVFGTSTSINLNL